MKQQMFGHIDANYFYAACHLVFHPEQREEPVIVLSNNDAAVVSANPAAKHLGLTKGTSFFQVRDLLNRNWVHVYSSQYALYADMSRRFLDTLSQLVPAVEYYSIDEMFLNLTEVPPEARVELAVHLRKTIARHLRLPVAIGIGATKTLAKLANTRAKSDLSGIFDLADPRLVTELLAGTPIEDIWGIGPRRARSLHQLNVSSALELTHVPDPLLRHTLHLPVVRLAWELRGYSVLPLLHVPQPPHSLARSRSFGRPVLKCEELHEALTFVVSRASEQLRAQKRAASVLSVFIMTSPFGHDPLRYSNSCVLSLPRPTNSTFELLASASLALERIFRRGYAYAKIGVTFLEVVPASPLQRSFFDTPQDVERQSRLLQVVDTLNRRFGQDTIRVAALGREQEWQRKIGYPSPRLTTRWPEIPVVHS